MTVICNRAQSGKCDNINCTHSTPHEMCMTGIGGKYCNENGVCFYGERYEVKCEEYIEVLGDQK